VKAISISRAGGLGGRVDVFSATEADWVWVIKISSRVVGEVLLSGKSPCRSIPIMRFRQGGRDFRGERFRPVFMRGFEKA
jgi:hypothetical protein